LSELNRAAEESILKTESGKPIRFVPPSAADPYYEVHLFETGLVQTRPDNSHDLFNALVWLAFPRTKARINAMHAKEIPREGGKRGRRRDLITILDEGGAILAAAPGIEPLVRGMEWRKLFMEHAADFRILVLGHATMEQALAPHPGITCKALFVDPARDLDGQAAEWLATAGSAPGASPKDLPALPIFGYPGWYPGNGVPAFYADQRYFRPFKGLRTAAQ
jgi:hypothetical protein